MNKHSMKIGAILFLSVVTALCLAVTASAAEKYLTLPKTVYGQNEDILVTASGEGTDWVGIYARGETPGSPASIYWYYVAQDAEPGEAVDIRETRSNSRAEYEGLPPGEYTVWLLLNDGYEPFDSIDITVITTLELDKYSYTEGDDILVTANGEGKDWVGLYLKDEVPGGGIASIYWYYVAEGHTPMEPVSIKGETHNADRDDVADLPAGDYTMFLLSNDGYDVIDSIDFTIKEGKKEEPAKAEEATEPAKTEEPAEPASEPEPAEASNDTPASPEPAAADTGTSASASKSGCGSFVNGGFILLITLLGSAWIAKRR
ncbi:MAG: hypothetical protein IK132_03675 [Clostridia bacterium]|nr:hypothetical protein [Clostridia bacterium]